MYSFSLFYAQHRKIAMNLQREPKSLWVRGCWKDLKIRMHGNQWVRKTAAAKMAVFSWLFLTATKAESLRLYALSLAWDYSRLQCLGVIISSHLVALSLH
ncbi:hypothetical protein NE237_013508 [Protea cynaroides]|uniref:Uncharacterized protein n=1 Tax=Protea cynaroides TaxID=273540 RepID=A0A9Q0H282_9MAGN|nr:hypothetical protein NE237_013508 [Protea cynaroides]